MVGCYKAEFLELLFYFMILVGFVVMKKKFRLNLKQLSGGHANPIF